MRPGREDCTEGCSMKIPCTCGCSREYPSTEIHDMRVIKRLSKACIARMRAEPRVPHSGPKRQLPWGQRMGGMRT